MNKYRLDKNLYWQTVWFIRRYPESRLKYENCIGRAASQDGMPHGSGISDPTARDADLRMKLWEDIRPIEMALIRVPINYRKGLLDNVVYRKPYPDYAGTTTWKRWRRRFVYWVAEEAGWLKEEQ